MSLFNECSKLHVMVSATSYWKLLKETSVKYVIQELYVDFRQYESDLCFVNQMFLIAQSILMNYFEGLKKTVNVHQRELIV